MGLRINVVLKYGNGAKRVVHLTANSREMVSDDVKVLCDTLEKKNGQPTAQLALLLSKVEVVSPHHDATPQFMLGELQDDPDFIIEIKPCSVKMVNCE